MTEVMLGLVYRSSVLVSLRFLGIAAFSAIIAAFDSVRSRKRNRFQNAVAFTAILSLSFLPHLAHVNLQVENATTDLAYASVLSKHIVTILCSR